MRCLLLAALVGCGSSTPPASEPASAAPASSAPTEPRADVAPAPPAEPAAVDARITDAIGAVTPAMLEADVRALGGPRSTVDSPQALAAAAAHVERELSRAGFTVTRQPVTYRGATADNVVGERPGSDPSRVVVVGAHYDTVPGAPGADDNASGVAAMLAVARAVGRFPTRATIRMVAFAFEEDGLVGSAKWVESLDDAQTHRITLGIVFDMVAYRVDAEGSQRFPPGMELLAPGRPLPTRGNFIGVLGLTDLPAPAVAALATSRAYAGDLAIETLSVPPEMVLMAPDLLRGDHASLWLAEIPALAVGDTGDFRNPNYHRPSDAIETLDFAFAASVARWSAALTLVAAEPR